MQADVQGLMRGELGDWLSEQNSMRDAANKKAYDRWFYGGIALLPVMAFIWFLPISSFDLKLFAAGAAIVGIGTWGYQPINEAKKTIKIGINTAIARDLGIHYEHAVSPGSEFHKAEKYGLVPQNHDRDSYEDRWFGELGGNRFNLYEAHLEERRGSGKHRRWVTVFRGVIIALPFGREFRSTTLLQRKGKHKKWFGLGGRKDVVEFGGHRMDYVDQVHPHFEDVFEVFSDDQVEARVLIHPTYVEHLIALEKAFHGQAIRALFNHGELVIAVEGEDMFESGSMKAEDDNARAQETADQFAALAQLMLAINQNGRGRAQEIKREPVHPGISEYAREATPRAAGGFGRKGL